MNARNYSLTLLALTLAGCVTPTVQNDASKWTIELTSFEPSESSPCRIYDAQHRLMLEGTLASGKMDGTWTSTGSDGTRLATWSYRQGVRHGPVKMWYGALRYPDVGGHLKLEGTFADGEYDGTVTRYYPFGYKHWCVPDDEFIAHPVQFCGQGLTLNERGEYVPLKNLFAHLKAKPSIRQELHTLKAQLKPGEMERSIWLVHQPPTELGMDICGTGEQVGSPAVLEFARVNQPLLGCSGHIHESPYQPGGRWMRRLGRTLWLQPGQMGHRLHYVRVGVSDKGAVEECWHSVLGAAQSRRGDMSRVN